MKDNNLRRRRGLRRHLMTARTRIFLTYMVHTSKSTALSQLLKRNRRRLYYEGISYL